MQNDKYFLLFSLKIFFFISDGKENSILVDDHDVVKTIEKYA